MSPVVSYTTGMSTRLQVVVKDEELEAYASTAEALGMSMSEWVRQSLRAAQRRVSTGDVEAKLAAIRKAVSLEPGGREVDIETMLAETEAARLAQIEASMGGGGDA